MSDDQAQLNVAIVRKFYDIVGGSAEGTPSSEVAAFMVDTFKNERSIELCLGEPYGGVFEGPAEIAFGRHRLHELAGYEKPDHTSFRYSSASTSRVIVEAVNRGADASGKAWSMKVVEFVEVIGGKIVHKRTFFQDPQFLRSIMLEREALLKEKLVEKHWREFNPFRLAQNREPI